MHSRKLRATSIGHPMLLFVKKSYSNLCVLCASVAKHLFRVEQREIPARDGVVAVVGAVALADEGFVVAMEFHHGGGELTMVDDDRRVALRAQRFVVIAKQFELRTCVIAHDGGGVALNLNV